MISCIFDFTMFVPFYLQKAHENLSSVAFRTFLPVSCRGSGLRGGAAPAERPCRRAGVGRGSRQLPRAGISGSWHAPGRSGWVGVAALWAVRPSGRLRFSPDPRCRGRRKPGAPSCFSLRRSVYSAQRPRGASAAAATRSAEPRRKNVRRSFRRRRSRCGDTLPCLPGFSFRLGCGSCPLR